MYFLRCIDYVDITGVLPLGGVKQWLGGENEIYLS